MLYFGRAPDIRLVRPHCRMYLTERGRFRSLWESVWTWRAGLAPNLQNQSPWLGSVWRAASRNSCFPDSPCDSTCKTDSRLFARPLGGHGVTLTCGSHSSGHGRRVAAPEALCPVSPVLRVSPVPCPFRIWAVNVPSCSSQVSPQLVTFS